VGGAGECGAERARTISYAEKVVNAEEIGLKYLQKSQAFLSKEPYICERVLCISKRALHPFHSRSAFPHMSSEHLKKSPQRICVLQCVALCFNVLQCVALCFNVLQCVALCFNVL